jgi:adenylate kinase family enzyme
MQRVVIFGHGGSGKTVLSNQLGQRTGLPVVELDKVYWDNNLSVLSEEEWIYRQSQIVADDEWVIHGDLGPYDVTWPRLERADTVVILDTHVIRCLIRAIRRGARHRDFWVWMLTWGRVHRHRIIDEVRQFSPSASLVILRSPREASRWLERL